MILGRHLAVLPRMNAVEKSLGRGRKVTGGRSESHWGEVGKSLGRGRKVTGERSESHRGVVGKSPNIYANIYAHFFSRMTALLHMPLKIDFEGQGGTEP